MKIKPLFAILGVVALLGLGAWAVLNTSNNPGFDNKYGDFIQVDSPKVGAAISSPLVVTGRARGSWYFEASFPVRLVDGNGKQLMVVPAQAQGDWMTENFVPFKATLTFEPPTTKTGTLVFKNDNPSGLPENDKEIRIPIQFADYKEIRTAEFGKPVTMSVKDEVIFPDGLVLNLTRISDSRCQKGVVCIWAGELSAVLSVTGGGVNDSPKEITIGTVLNKSISLDGHTFSLMSATENNATVIVSVAGATNILGGITGYIHMGPTCPVERTPPDPNCGDRPYAGADVRVEIFSSGVLVNSLVSDATGNFRVNILPGRYVVVAGPQMNGGPSADYPSGGLFPRCQAAGAIVKANEITSIDISCDTGIR